MPAVKVARKAPAVPPRKRGFAAISAERRRQIASLGGKAAHASGRAHQFNSVEARAASLRGHMLAKEKELASLKMK